MFKRIALLSLLCFALAPFPTNAAPQQSAVGKVAAALIKIAHRHAYLLAWPAAPLSFGALRDHRDDYGAAAASFVVWYFAGRLLKTTTKVIMDACDIDPVQD